jgi:hypothetical protein
MSILTRLRRGTAKQQWDVVTWPWGGWNYPEPILSDDQWAPHDRQPVDPHLKHLVYMAEYGWHYYQKAFVDMSIIHPYTNYQPFIHDEFRETFDAHYEERGMPLLLYEKGGKLIMSNDWEAYWLYREREDPSVPCIILGHFNHEEPGIAVCDRPFMVERPEHLLKPRHALTTW